MNAAVLPILAAAIAKPGWQSLVQNLLQLASLLAEEEQLQLATASMHLSPPTEDGLLTVEQAVSTLNVSSQTIYSWVRKGDLLTYKLGRRIYFKKAELLGALRQQTRPDSFHKKARRSFVPNNNLGKEVAYA